MGKRIEELHDLDDTPIQPVDDDDRAAPWSRFLTEINDLLATGRYTWAESTLDGIAATVTRSKRVTQNQRDAVHRIEEAGLRPSEGGRRSRRYEGYGWRR